MYDLRVCENVTQEFDACKAINDTMLLFNGTLNSPQASGTLETVFLNLDHLDIPENDTSYYAMIKAVDGYGNMGPDSNLAQIPGPVTPEPEPPMTPAPKSPSSNTVAIVAGTIVCLAVLAAGTFGGVFMYKNKQKNKVSVI